MDYDFRFASKAEYEKAMTAVVTKLSAKKLSERSREKLELEYETLLEEYIKFCESVK